MSANNDRQILLVTGHSQFSSRHSCRKGSHLSHLKDPRESWAKAQEMIERMSYHRRDKDVQEIKEQLGVS
jgi:hypothetical protein